MHVIVDFINQWVSDTDTSLFNLYNSIGWFLTSEYSLN